MSAGNTERPPGTVRIEQLSKKYPVYDRPSQKVLEILSFRKLQLHREYWALQDLDLDLEPGTTLGVVGPNGSAKRTLLQLIAGILSPTRGVCAVSGSVAALLELGAGFNPEFSGRENVFMNAAIQGLTNAQIESRFDDILDFAEIGEFIEQPVKTYSSGMFMRLAFSAAIHVDPDILLVDEALAVGDLIFQHRCVSRIRRMRREGKTILFVTHDLQAITKFCDRAILLDGGRILLDGSPEKVASGYQQLIFEREQKRAGDDAYMPQGEQDEALPEVNTIPNIDNRYGDGGAQIRGIIIQSTDGRVLNEVQAGQEVLLLVSARYARDFDHPIVGFTIRDHLGVEIGSSNTSYQGRHLPPAGKGETVIVGFRIVIPAIRPGSYSISPAVARGTIWEHKIEDWVENAYIMQVADTGLVYGMMKWPVEASYRVRGMGKAEAKD